MDLSWQGARCLRVAILMVAIASPAIARAESAFDEPTAEALFTEGRRLLAEKNYAEACPKLAESHRLDPAIGTLLNLGDCYEKSGRSASAWARFREATEAAHRAKDAAREKVAQRRAKSLEERLMRLTITAPPASSEPGFEVLRDGVAMGDAVFGTAVPVDPGPHKIEARAPGKKPWSATVTLDAAHASLAVAIPPLEAIPVAPPAPPPLSVAAPSPDADEKDATRGRGQRVAAVVVVGLGVAAVSVGSVFGVLASSKKDASDSHCKGNVCDQRGVDLRDQALTNAMVSTSALVGGAAALTCGAVLWFTAPSKREPAQAGLRAVPYASPSSMGAVFSGAF